MKTTPASFSALPTLDLSWAHDPAKRPQLLSQVHEILYNVGFCYVINHEVPSAIIESLVSQLPALFDMPAAAKTRLTKLNSPHFLGYSGFAEEITLNQRDLREQFDFATELPIIWQPPSHGVRGTLPEHRATRDFSKLYWRLRGPNQWPAEEDLPGFRQALSDYHDAVANMSYEFVHLVEEAFGIPIGTFDNFFKGEETLQPQHRIKLLKYPPSNQPGETQGVGAHKDSSGWLTFLYQVGEEEGLEVVNSDGEWIWAPPLKDSFVLNFGNAFEAATQGSVKATTHRVKAPGQGSNTRYSIPFFQGLPLDLTVSEIQQYIPEAVRQLRHQREVTSNGTPATAVQSFLDPRWDSLGESQLRKWCRSHPDVARKWYGDEVTNYYIQP